MRLFKIVFYWIGVILIMTLLYRSLLGSTFNALFLSVLLMPGALFMTWGIGHCRRQNGWKRWLHAFYVLVVALYLEWMALVLAYWLLFEYQISSIPKVMVNPIFLMLYMICFALLQERLFPAKTRAKPAVNLFTITSERRKIQINLEELRYIESKNEQIYFHLQDQTLPSRERISQVQGRLPDNFLRVHRSFIVNTRKVTQSTSQALWIGEQEIPVSRKYRGAVELSM